MKTVLYTTHCRKCEILEQKLNEKSINYDLCDDSKLMQDKGYIFLPVLEVDGKSYDYLNAVRYINSL